MEPLPIPPADELLIICKFFLVSLDPFADAKKGDDDYIHIRIQQRNGRKTLTTVQGIAVDYDKKKLVKAFKKVCVQSQSVYPIAMLAHLSCLINVFVFPLF